MSMKKIGIVVVGLAVVLAFPVVNLFIGAPSNTRFGQAAAKKANFAPVARLLERKCANCHSKDYKLPFYASFPFAKGLIEADIKEGIRRFDLVEDLLPHQGEVPSETALAKIEREIVKGAMPPGKYIAMHWYARISAEDKATLLGWIKSMRVKYFAPKGLPVALAEAAIHPLPLAVQVNEAKAALGRQLYHDKRLSGDDTLSCASCHDLAKGGTDQAKVSTGIRGQKGGINAPTTFNSAYQFKQFWDGRAATLEEQAGGPPLNPVEMGGSWPKIVEKLKADTALNEAFLKVYPAGFSAKTITDAIAEFERTLLTPNAPFDRFLRGDKAALSAEAQQGYAHFQQLGCQRCHVGKLLGGQSFELMGRARDYFAQRGTKLTDADAGRFGASKNERDRGRFKVPTLRNVALTFPYFHDASAATLEQAVKTMAFVQLGRKLPVAELKVMVAFLKSLTGTYLGKSL